MNHLCKISSQTTAHKELIEDDKELKHKKNVVKLYKISQNVWNHQIDRANTK